MVSERWSWPQRSPFIVFGISALPLLILNARFCRGNVWCPGNADTLCPKQAQVTSSLHSLALETHLCPWLCVSQGLIP